MNFNYRGSALVGVMVFLVFAQFGFGQAAAKNSEAAVVFSILVNNREGAEFNPDWLILKEVEKLKNVRFAVRLGKDGAYLPALAEAMKSADIPDIILKVWPDDIVQYAEAGLLLPISDYEYMMPYFTKYIRDNGLRAELDKLRDSHGKYFLLPGYQREIQVQQWIYRKDIFDKFALPTPASYDDLFRALAVLKQKYPQSAPISACWGGAHLFAMMGAGYGIQAGWNGDRMYDRASDSWKYSPGTANWKEMVRFLTKCYKAGLLDPELFTQDPQAFEKKLGNGSTFATVTWISSGFSKWNKQLEDSGFAGANWAPLMPPKSTVGMEALPSVNSFRKGTAVSVGVMRKPYFKKLLEFLDWMYYSDEGRALAVWGVKGLTYSEAGGKKEFLPAIKTSANPGGTMDGGKDFGLNLLFDLCEFPEYEDGKKPPAIVEFLGQSLERKLTVPLEPKLLLEKSDLDGVKIIEESLRSYMNEAMKAFITGTADIDAGWKSYKETLEKKGSVELERIWNAAWKKGKK